MILQSTDYTYITILHQQISKFCKLYGYLHFGLKLVTVLNLCLALKFRTYTCVYTKSKPVIIDQNSEIF